MGATGLLFIGYKAMRWLFLPGQEVKPCSINFAEFLCYKSQTRSFIFIFSFLTARIYSWGELYKQVAGRLGRKAWNCSRKEGMSHSGKTVWWVGDFVTAGCAPALLLEKQTLICLARTDLCKLGEMISLLVLGSSVIKRNCFSFLKEHSLY